MKYFQKNTTVKNITLPFGLMCFRNIITGKTQIKKRLTFLQILLKATTHPQKHTKANRKKAKLEINRTEKGSIGKKERNTH